MIIAFNSCNRVDIFIKYAFSRPKGINNTVSFDYFEDDYFKCGPFGGYSDVGHNIMLATL